MGGLAHYIERAGIATTQISLVREHTEKIKPPRALVVPFELGRPFGAPLEPDFQRRVLLDVLALLERDEGPVLETFPDEPPGSGDAEDGEGWACPVNFGPGLQEADVTEDPLGALTQEMDRLKMWYDLGLKERNGRTTVGISGVPLSDLTAYLTAFIKDEDTAPPRTDIPRERVLKYAIDEMKAYYFEASSAQPGTPSDKELSDWYYGETVAAEILRDINTMCANSADEDLAMMSDRRIFPIHQQHRKRETAERSPHWLAKPKE